MEHRLRCSLFFRGVPSTWTPPDSPGLRHAELGVLQRAEVRNSKRLPMSLSAEPGSISLSIWGEKTKNIQVASFLVSLSNHATSIPRFWDPNEKTKGPGRGRWVS